MLCFRHLLPYEHYHGVARSFFFLIFHFKHVVQETLENYIFETWAAQLIKWVNILMILYFVNDNTVLMLCRKMKID